MPLQIFPDGLVVAALPFTADFAVKAGDIGQQSPESWAKEVAALGEQAVQVTTVVLQPGAVVAYRKAHLALLSSNPEFVDQVDEIGVGPVVEDDKPGIDRRLLSLFFHVYGVGMATDISGRFKDLYVVVAEQAVGATEPGNPRTDNRDLFHLSSSAFSGPVGTTGRGAED